MDSESGCQPGTTKPKRLKTLALSVEFPGRNILLHQFVLDNSDPNESVCEIYINAALMSMADAPSNLVNALNGDGHTALHLAVMKNNLLMTEKLLSCLLNIDVNAIFRYALESVNLSIDGEIVDEDEATALCIAAESGDLNMMKLLVSKGVNVNHKGFYVTPLYNAALSKNLEAVMFLVNSGADVKTTAATGHTPLHAAVCMEGSENVEFSVDKGFYFRARNKICEIPHHYAACKTLKITSFLIDQGADVNAADAFGTTPLHKAARYSIPKLKIVEFLISRGADLHAVDFSGKTMLHYAVCSKSLVDASCSIDEHANLDAVDKVRKVPTPSDAGFASGCLHDAISSVKSNLDILEFSIGRG